MILSCSICNLVCLVGTEDRIVKTEDRIVKNRKDRNYFGLHLWKTELLEDRKDQTEQTEKTERPGLR